MEEQSVSTKGPATKYRPKDRGGVSLSLTRVAKDLLEGASIRTNQSKSDVVEELLRKHGDEVTGSTST